MASYPLQAIAGEFVAGDGLVTASQISYLKVEFALAYAS